MEKTVENGKKHGGQWWNMVEKCLSTNYFLRHLWSHVSETGRNMFPFWVILSNFVMMNQWMQWGGPIFRAILWSKGIKSNQAL
jgi:hypothetical protein